jgi:hypothetical protein
VTTIRYCSADSAIFCSDSAAFAAARCASREAGSKLIHRAATAAESEGCKDSAVTSLARASSDRSVAEAAAAVYCSAATRGLPRDKAISPVTA